MTDEILKAIGEEFKVARESKELTIKQVFLKIRIDYKVLEGIEAGNFSVVPEVYIRAFIKEYANFLELDAEDILYRYIRAKTENIEEISVTKDDNDTPKNERKTYQKSFDASYEYEPLDEETYKVPEKKYLIYYLIGGMIIILVAVYFLFLQGDDQQIIKEQNDDVIINEQTERYKPIEQDTNSYAVLKSDSILLRITVVEETWMRVTVDNRKVDEYTLQPNTTKDVYAKSKFNLVVGNAGGIKLSLNNKELESLGKSGEIKNIQIDAEGLKFLNITTRSNEPIN